MNSLRTLLALVVFLAVGAAIAPAAGPKKITPKGVDGVKLGMTHAELREQGLVKRMRRGCPLGGDDTRAAKLKKPLEGIVGYTKNRPRKARDITITGGAKARGVGIGDRIPDIKAAYPKAKVNRDTEDTFGITLVRVPKKGGGPLRFGVSTETERITIIGVPYIAFCE
ncbi:MAG TPA: hypothetical protein VD790_00300 [Thermoleophilaceae bacterium]|nr:hypothetical protein [Thermoleophilaceae bacterium]